MLLLFTFLTSFLVGKELHSSTFDVYLGSSVLTSSFKFNL